MIKKTLKKIGYVSAFLMFSTVTAYAQEVRHCRSTNFQQINPVSAGVKRVVVAVNMSGNNIELPDPLKKENIESLLKELYEKRFSTFGGTLLPTSTPGCHDRNDQPVTVIDLTQSGGWDKFEDATRDPETLSAMLHFQQWKRGVGGMDINSDFVTFYLSVMRPNVSEIYKNRVMTAFAITTSTKVKTIQDLMIGVLEDRIKYQ